jgi:hypothetical protein
LWNTHGFLSFGRWDAKESVAVAINNNATPIEVSLPVWKIGQVNGFMTREAAVFDEKYHSIPLRFIIKDGAVRLTVPAQGALVLAAEQ